MPTVQPTTTMTPRAPFSSLLCLLGASAGAVYAADGTAETVSVKDFALIPLSSLGFAERTVEVHPKALVGTGYDDNLYLNAPENDQTGAWYVRGVAGVDLRWLPNETDRVVFDGEVERSLYRDNPERDFTGVGSSVRGNHDGPLLALAGEAGYQRTQDPLVETRQIVPRDLWNIIVDGDYKGLLDTWTVGLRHEGVRYREDFSGYSADEASYGTIGAFARYGYQLAEEDELYARCDVDRIVYREDGAFNDSIGVRGVVGVQRGVGARTEALLEAGLAWRHYDDYFHAPDPIDPTVTLYGDSRQAWGPSGKALLRYSWEELSAISLSASSEITDSLTANTAWYGSLGASLRQRLLTNCAALAGMQTYRFVDLDNIEGIEPESRTTNGANLGLEFFLRDGVGIRIMATYENSHARISESYERFTVFTDLAVVF